VVYRPADLGKLGKRKLGLYIFGNGACSNDGASSRLHLLEIASHGYLAVAPGRIRSGPGATVAPQAEAPRPTAGSKLPTPPTTAADLLAALDWALAQNKDARSPFYRKIDQDRGRLFRFQLRRAAGPADRLGSAREDIDRDEQRNLQRQHAGHLGHRRLEGPAREDPLADSLHPGRRTDIAYANGMDDFQRIKQVPAFSAISSGSGTVERTGSRMAGRRPPRWSHGWIGSCAGMHRPRRPSLARIAVMPGPRWQFSASP
jgi:hypothetical protein